MYKQLMAFIITIACLLGFIPENKVNAEQQGLQLPFTVQVQRHSLQDTNISSYYKLDVSEQKGETVTLQVLIKNVTDETIQVRTETANALTSTSGGIDYNPLDKTEFASFINEDYAIKQNVTGLPKQITLKGNEARMVEFQVQIPENAEGTYLTGVSFLVDAAIKPTDTSIAVNSVIGRTIAVQLDVSDTPVLDAEFADAEFASAGGVPTIRVLMENHSKAIHPGVNAPYVVYKKKTMEKVFEGEIKGVKMAPSTKVFYQIQWQGTIEPGDYIVKIGKDTEFKFGVNEQTVEDIAKIQGFDVKVTKDFSFFWWILILLIILNLLLWFLYLKKKSEAQKAKMLNKELLEEAEEKLELEKEKEKEKESDIYKE